MAGSPPGDAARPRTVLEHLLWQEEHTYEEIAARFEQVATELGERATLSPRHLRRLASGERSGTTPATRRVLRVMFGQPAEQLLSPWRAGSEVTGRQRPEVVELLPGDDRLVLVAAAGRAHAFVFELSKSNVSGESMDQLHDDVAALAASYQRQAPSSIIADLVTTQERIFSLLEGRQQVTNTRRLLLLAGVTSGLLAKISHDLADPHTALTQSRTAYLCADNADHNGMRAWIRGLQSLITYWAGRYHDAVRYAQHGAQFATRGTSGVWLPMCEARAWAALGNEVETMAAIRRAETNRESTQPDEIDELGGLCTFSPTRQTYYAADALAWLPSLAPSAEDYAQQAVAAYQDNSTTDWAFGDAAGAATDLAIARIQRHEIDGAASALEPVLALPPRQRINGIVTSINHVYTTLINTPTSPTVRDLQERIEDFTATPLRALGA
jgi:cytochrome c553